MNVKFINTTDVGFTQLKNIVGNDVLRPVMMGIYIDFKEQVIVGTDAHCLVAYPIEIQENDTDKDGVIVPLALFNQVKYMWDMPAKMRKGMQPEFVLSDNYAEVYFLGELMYRCKYIEGKYPNYKAVIPNKEQAQNLSDIDFRFDILKKIASSFPVFNDPLKFTFFGQKKGVLVESTSDKYGRPVRGVVVSS